MHVCVTGHRTPRINEWLKEHKLSKQDFMTILKGLILLHFPKKEEWIFHLGGSDGFDNAVGWVLSELGYRYWLFVPQFDLNGRKYWSQKEMRVYNTVKKNAINVFPVKGGYLDRDFKMQLETECIFAFITSEKSGTAKTLGMWVDRVKSFYYTQVSLPYLIFTQKGVKE